MYTKQEQNLILFQKSKRKVFIHLIIDYILLCVYFGVIYYLFHSIDLLKITSNSFNTLLVEIGGFQLLLFGMTFALLLQGNKWFRFLYWFDVLICVGIIYFPISYLMKDLSSILPFFALIACMLIKIVFLLQIGGYLKNDRWAIVFFDHTIELESEDDDWVEKETSGEDYNKATKYADKFEESDEEDEVIYKAPLTYPQFAVRLGIVVYASLMIFPIFCQIFANLFESMDMQKVFATKQIFIFCIFSTFIWTIAIFFLYYSHRFLKKIVVGCMAGEILRMILYVPTMIDTYKGGEYALRVFILFVIIDLIRVTILFVCATQILKSDQGYLESPRD